MITSNTFPLYAEKVFEANFFLDSILVDISLNVPHYLTLCLYIYKIRLAISFYRVL